MLLLLLIAVPLLGGLGLITLGALGMDDRTRERVGIGIAIASLLIGGLLTYQVIQAAPPESNSRIVARIEYSPEWLQLRLPAALSTNNQGWQLSLGLDGIGAELVLLTLIVTLSVMFISQGTIDTKRGSYFAWLLLATSGLLLVFASMDLVLFYIGFEVTLIPLFMMMVGWGKAQATDAAKRFTLYTLLGSIPMVLALFGISQLYSGDTGWTVHLPTLSSRAAESLVSPPLYQSQLWIFSLLVFGLGIKTAILPLHTWLPATYSQSHPTTTAFLAAIVLKMGVFGFIRLVLPFTPIVCAEVGPSMMGWLGAIAIVAGALLALAQKDIALLLAYSSLSHVGFITVGLFSLTQEGIGGATLQMFNHGITTAAMFLLVACILVRRKNLRLDEQAGGMGSVYPRLALFTVFFTVAGVGMPGLNNFVGELLGLTGMMTRRPLITVVASLGIVLGAWYSLRMVQYIFFGNDPRKDSNTRKTIDAAGDLNGTQKLTFGALALICLAIGVMPNWAIGLFKGDVERLSRGFSLTTSSAANPVTVPSVQSIASANEIYSAPSVQDLEISE
jgi:NADH-quinone oxidoreductase subunit M